MTRIRQKNVTAAQWSPTGSPSARRPDPARQPLLRGQVFSSAEQEKRLPRDVFEKLQATLERGEALDLSLADAVAEAMKEWALEKGATHYTHVFSR